MSCAAFPSIPSDITFATRLDQKTADLYLVQRALGHRQITTTEIYARVSDDRLRWAVTTAEVVRRMAPRPMLTHGKSRLVARVDSGGVQVVFRSIGIFQAQSVPEGMTYHKQLDQFLEGGHKIVGPWLTPRTPCNRGSHIAKI